MPAHKRCDSASTVPALVGSSQMPAPHAVGGQRYTEARSAAQRERRSPNMGCGAPSVALTRVAATPETPGARRTRRQNVALVARAAPAPEAHHPPLPAPAGVRRSAKPRRPPKRKTTRRAAA